MHVIEPSAKQIMQEHFEAKQDEWHDPIDSVYHAHTAWRCHRQSWYRRRGYPEEGDLPYGLFEMGHAVEAAFTKALQNHYGYSFVFQDVPCQERFTVQIMGEEYEGFIRGRTDPAIYGFNMEPRILYECKSKQGTGDGPFKVKTEEHQKMQAAWYADRLGFPEVRIVHPGRNDLLKMPDNDTVMLPDQITKRSQQVREYFRRQFMIDLRNVPPPGRPFWNRECQYCPFKNQCDQDGGPGTKADPDSYLTEAPARSIVAADGGGKGAWNYEEEEE